MLVNCVKHTKTKLSKFQIRSGHLLSKTNDE